MKIRALKFLKQAVHPKTFLAGKKKFTYFNNVNKDLQKYENIYRKGGLISQAIDAYPLFGLSSGYTLEGAPKDMKAVQAWLDKIDVEQLMWQAWVDSLVYGDSIQEMVYSKKGDLLYLVPRNPKYFTIDVDQWGMIEGYTQRADNKETKLKPEKVSNLALISLSGESYGHSLIGRAEDDIMRDTLTAEGTAVAIHRHGFPRYHIIAGDIESNDKFSDEEKKAMKTAFEDLKPDNEFITDPNVKIIPIDTQGIAKIATYNEWSMSRLLGALGVPSEVIGTGQSTTTYATASVEMVSFMKKIETHQRIIARCYNRVIDIRTGMPGSVTLTFNKLDKEGLANVDSTKSMEA